MDYSEKMKNISRLMIGDPEPDSVEGRRLLDLTTAIQIEEALNEVDGSTVNRVTTELINRGGEDAILGKFLQQKVLEYWAEAYPESYE